VLMSEAEVNMLLIDSGNRADICRGNVTRQGRCPDGAKVLHQWSCFPNARTDRFGGLPRSLGGVA